LLEYIQKGAFSAIIKDIPYNKNSYCAEITWSGAVLKGIEIPKGFLKKLEQYSLARRIV